MVSSRTFVSWRRWWQNYNIQSMVYGSRLIGIYPSHTRYRRRREFSETGQGRNRGRVHVVTARARKEPQHTKKWNCFRCGSGEHLVKSCPKAHRKHTHAPRTVNMHTMRGQNRRSTPMLRVYAHETRKPDEDETVSEHVIVSGADLAKNKEGARRRFRKVAIR